MPEYAVLCKGTIKSGMELEKHVRNERGKLSADVPPDIYDGEQQIDSEIDEYVPGVMA